MPLKKKKKTAALKRPAKKAAAKKKRPAAKPRAATKKKTAVKRPTLKKSASPAKKALLSRDVLGEVTHYFPKVGAGVIKLKAPLNTGEKIRIKGHTTDFTQTVSSMQVDHLPLEAAKKGDEIGLLVDSRVRAGDMVYRAQ